MVLYKVVTPRDRTSVMNLFTDVYNRRYSKKYEIGEVVEAEPNTLGIFCFTSKSQAVQWMRKTSAFSKQYKILKVKPLTKPRRKIPKISKRLTEERISYFYSNLLNRSTEQSRSATTTAPPGTVCVKRVEVLT